MVQVFTPHDGAAAIVGVVFVASYFRAFFFIIVPVVLAAIFRFRVAGAAVVLLVVTLFGTVFIVQDIGSPLLLQTAPAERLLAFAGLPGLDRTVVISRGRRACAT